MPIAVAENKVGNISEFAKNTRLKVLEVPVFATMIKKGIQIVNYYRNIIIAPPNIVKEMHTMNEVRTPNF